MAHSSSPLNISSVEDAFQIWWNNHNLQVFEDVMVQRNIAWEAWLACQRHNFAAISVISEKHGALTFYTFDSLYTDPNKADFAKLKYDWIKHCFLEAGTGVTLQNYIRLCYGDF